MGSRRNFIRDAAVAIPMVGRAWSKQPCPVVDPKIQRMVVLMLENRSFDHLLGFTFQGGLNAKGFPYDLSTLPPNLDPETQQPVLPQEECEFSGDFYPDPGHDFEDVTTQLFNAPGPPHGNPNMQGFVSAYFDMCGRFGNERPDRLSPAIQCRRIMNAYRPDKVPVLATLAQQFAVCDHWFCSVPGPTLPNRKFVHAGTSKGQLDLSVAEFNVSPTVYEVLDGDNVSSVIYADGWTAAATFRNLIKYQDRFFGTLDDFYQDCAENRLPGYCFLEPRYASGLTNGVFRPQNDQHPDSDVHAGEDLIYSIFSAIRSNPKVWKNTMLVVVWDEHGGLFDHVCPPTTTPPDDLRDPRLHYFNFDRLGPRVPAVIVSAYTKAGTVLTQVFDHTSIIATARLLLNGKCNDLALGARAQNANTFESALNLDDQRNDPVDFGDYRVGRKVKRSKERRPNHLQQTWKQFAKHVNSNLPPSQRSPIDADTVNSDQDIQRYLESVYAGVRGMR
jgi:phospholipase C